MRRKLFTLASAVSLLLCVCVGVLWVQGGFYLFHLRYNRSALPDRSSANYFAASSYDGTLRFEFDRRTFIPAYLRGMSSEETDRFRIYYAEGLEWSVSTPSETTFLSVPSSGFDAIYVGEFGPTAANRAYRSNTSVLAVRHWLPMVLLLVMPGVWVNRFRKARRAKRFGLCPICGYDLRESPQRCPECGAAAPSAQEGLSSTIGDVSN